MDRIRVNNWLHHVLLTTVCHWSFVVLCSPSLTLHPPFSYKPPSLLFSLFVGTCTPHTKAHSPRTPPPHSPPPPPIPYHPITLPTHQTTRIFVSISDNFIISIFFFLSFWISCLCMAIEPRKKKGHDSCTVVGAAEHRDVRCMYSKCYKQPQQELNPRKMQRLQKQQKRYINIQSHCCSANVWGFHRLKLRSRLMQSLPSSPACPAVQYGGVAAHHPQNSTLVKNSVVDSDIPFFVAV